MSIFFAEMAVVFYDKMMGVILIWQFIGITFVLRQLAD